MLHFVQHDTQQTPMHRRISFLSRSLRLCANTPMCLRLRGARLFMVFVLSHGVKTSFAEENVAPGWGPPEMT
jgi:hypothetical protein